VVLKREEAQEVVSVDDVTLVERALSVQGLALDPGFELQRRVLGK
jgi:hypothetical protein